MYKYPYGDSQQLNLDWILAKIKDMEAAEASDLEKISQTLISLPYNTTTAYRRYDYAFLNGKLYRCLSNTTGAFDPSAWQEALIGDDLAVLTRWINAIDAAIDNRINRDDVDISTLTDNWLITAKDGAYKVTGTSRIGTFIEDADNNYGVLTIASAPHGSNDYGYITFHSTTGRTFYRDFVRTNSAITWRTALQEIAIESEISNLNGAITEINQNLAGKTIALLGDSNAANWAATNPFSDIPSVNFYSYAVGGARWTTTIDNNIEAQYNRMVAAGVNPDYVILQAGGNDIGHNFPDFGLPELGTYTEPSATTTFESMRRVLYKLRTNYPNAKLLGVTRDNRENSSVPINRFTFVMGIIERIYEAWKIPVISFDSICNICEEIPASRDNYTIYEQDYGHIHFNARGLAQFTRMIKEALRGGMITHSARRIEVLFAPTSCTTSVQASEWVLNSLFKGTGSWNNWWLEQKNYKVAYITNPAATPSSWVFGETFVSVYAPSIGMYTVGNDGHWYAKDNKNYLGTNHHEMLWFHECDQNVASLKDIPSGIVAWKVGQFANTVGIPSAFQSYFETGAGYCIGAWRPNGWYTGILILPFTANLNNMFTMTYNPLADKWEYWAADHSVFYDANGT